MRSDELEVDEYNPGEELQRLLKKIYPPDTEGRTSFIQRIDSGLRAEGDFAELVYDSCINYMVRRLITTAEYIRRQCDREGLPDPDRRFWTKFRDFLRHETDIPANATERVLGLLVKCARSRRQRPTDNTKKRIRAEAQNRGVRCYICGRDLDFTDPNSVQVEHKWPNALGGASQDHNLRVACPSCNRSKADFVDASDFHYEEICLVKDKTDAEFDVELRTDYRVALWAKSRFACSICGKPASAVGELEFVRRDPGDSWHFLNIDACCGKHARELG